MQCSEILLTEECLWCNHTGLMREQIDTLIQLMKCSPAKQPEWFQRMHKDLTDCSACVDQYHNAMKAHLCGSNNAIVYNWNCGRIISCLEEGLQLFESGDNDEFYDESITLCIETAIKEVLKYPRLMLKEQVCTLCLKSLKLLLKQNKSFELHERLQGLCLLLVNQDSQVRLWALKTFKSFGSVDCDEYAELESVIDWLLDVINFNLFINGIDIDNSANWDDTQKVVLPRHLFTSKPREFWLGLCTILTAMTKSCIQTCLLPSDLSHKELLESVLAHLDKDSDKEYGAQKESYNCKNTIFWPVLQCFVLLIDKLGSNLWMITSTTPKSIQKLIKSNPYYQSQLKICYNQAAQLDLATNNDTDFSFSQLVYNDSLSTASKSMEPLQERYHGFSLSWVVPFIKSLIDFGDFESSTILELLDFVCHVHSVSLHGDTNVSSTDVFQTVLPTEMVAGRVENLFLPQESLKCISQSVDVLFSQKVYSVLLQCKQAIFCMITVLCSYVLSRDRLVLSQNKQHLSQTARTYTSLVMYCSNEKTASKLWYLVKQISSLSPFLSVVSNQVGNSYGHNDLLQPDELCKTLLKLIADKQDNQDIAGPFLYPHSFNSSTLKRRTSSTEIKIKQESFEEETKSLCTTEESKPVVDHHLYHQESSSHCSSTSTEKTADSDSTSSGSNLKQVSLRIPKLPITVRKSDEGILHYEFKNKSTEVLSESGSEILTEPLESYMKSDTDSISSNSDDDDDDFPSYLPVFTKRRLTDTSTSSTITIESELNVQSIIQKGTAKEQLGRNVQLMSQSAQLKKGDDKIQSESDNVICDTKHNISAHSDSEENYLKPKDDSIKLKSGGDVKHDKETNTNADQEWCDYYEQNSDCVIVNSSSIVDLVLPEDDLHLSKNSVSEDTAVVDQSVSKPLIEQQQPIELDSVENMSLDSEDEDVFSADEHVSEPTLLEEQQQLNSNVDTRFPETEQMQCENVDSFTADKEANYVVVPNKQCNLKFKSKSMKSASSSDEITNSDSLNSYEPAKLSHASPIQQPSTVSKQLDKIQPAVAGRAPFSKSRMASLPSSSPLKTNTKVQATKAKNSIASKDLHKPVGQSSSTETAKVAVKIETSRAYSKEEFLLEVLSWDPSAFFQTEGTVVNKGPYSLPNIAKLPVTFKSSDQYIEVFKPLLLLEAWDTIKEEMKHAREQERVFHARIDDCNLTSLTDVSAHHRLTCKGIIAKNGSHPLDRDLVRIKCIPHGTKDTSLDFPVMFGTVEGISKHANAEIESSEVSSKSAKELTLHLVINRCNGNFHFLSDNMDIEVLTVVSMSSFVRQWEGLIAVSRNMLCRDILHPRNKKYFGYFDDIEPTAKDREYQIDEFSFNASQFEAITLSTKALSLSYCIPQIVLLQGPPGTGKTHTIVGIIASFFTSQKSTALVHSNVIPGNRLKAPKPHLLVCAPSNAAVDVVVNRLMMKGLIVGTEPWKRRCERMRKQSSTSVNGFRVLRVGVPDKIDPKILPISLDEVIKRKSTEVSKKLQEIKDDIARVDSEIAKLNEEITFAQKRIVSLKFGSKDEQLYCKELNANVNDLSSKAKQQRAKRLQLTRETTKYSSDIKTMEQKVLTEADIICCTLTSSGSKKLRECFQSKPQHFTAVIVDEAAQCCELLTLIPLLYRSTKLLLVGDPQQLPSTVRSKNAERLGYGQSLFERLFYHFTHENSNSNPVMMLQIQYRMNSKICQFPSEQFYHNQLLTHSIDSDLEVFSHNPADDSFTPLAVQPGPNAKCPNQRFLSYSTELQCKLLLCDKEIPLNPLLVFDLHDGAEHIKDGNSYSNKLECRLIVKMCNTLLEVVSSSNIGIITPYKAQTKMIQMYIKSSICRDIEIGTVDSFQGREKDIILLSCVRVQPGGSIGFLTDHRRLNVAITRAKKALYIIGHLRTFQFNKYWSNLFAHAEKQKVIVRVDENMSCVEECLKVNSSVSVTENQACMKDNHEVQLALPSSSHSTVTEESSDLLVTDKRSTVDRSAFIPQKKSTKYTDALPKNSPSKKTQRSNSASELRHKDYQPSPKKALVSSTDDKHKKLSSSSKSILKDQTALSSMDKQKVTQHDETAKPWPVPSPSLTAINVLQNSKQTNYRTEVNPGLASQMAIQTMDKSSSSNTKATSTSKSSVSHRSIPSVSSVPCSVPYNMVYPHGTVNTHTPSSGRHVTFSNDDSNVNRMDKWGGQRKRTSHFTNMSLAQQVKRKGRHSDDNGSKKAKLN